LQRPFKIHKFKEKIYPSHATAASGFERKILAEGIVEERMVQGDGYIKIAKIENVLYVPSMKKNLLSIPQLSEKCVALGGLENELYCLKTFLANKTHPLQIKSTRVMLKTLIFDIKDLAIFELKQSKMQ